MTLHCFSPYYVDYCYCFHHWSEAAQQSNTNATAFIRESFQATGILQPDFQWHSLPLAPSATSCPGNAQLTTLACSQTLTLTAISLFCATAKRRPNYTSILRSLSIGQEQRGLRGPWTRSAPTRCCLSYAAIASSNASPNHDSLRCYLQDLSFLSSSVLHPARPRFPALQLWGQRLSWLTCFGQWSPRACPLQEHSWEYCLRSG